MTVTLYEWNEVKRRANLAKHGVDFTAIHDFEWDTANIELDEHDEERRWIARGLIESRLHVAVLTLRGRRIRVISLRKANRREEQHHARHQDR